MVGSRSLPIHPEAGIDSFIEVPARINECRILSMYHNNIPVSEEGRSIVSGPIHP